ncbi:MAG: SEC-C domain-containing protein [Anaerolineae bacterium]|nr:SEC-C domain-containing protein [Anaerolineae bacterium]
MTYEMEPEAGTSDKVYQIRVDLNGIRPPIWRRLLIPEDYTLDWVHETLQVAMGWWGGHLHMFTRDGEAFCPPEYEFDDTVDEATVRLADLLPQVGSKAKYEYDFGDGWVHTLQLEKVLPADPEEIYPQCVKGRRACPPEDVGGIPGYHTFLDALANPERPESQDYIEWYGGEVFDPEAFDAMVVNLELKDIGYAADGGSMELYDQPITLVRQEMLSPALLQLLGMVLPEDDASSEMVGRQERLLRRSRSATKLLDILPALHPSLFELWLERMKSAEKRFGPLIIEKLTAPVPDDDEARQQEQWVNGHLMVLLNRSVPEAVTLLVDAWDAMGSDTRSLACLVFGLQNARETADLVRGHCEALLAQGDYASATGALWALVDFEDAMATEVLTEVLEAEAEFPEVFPMLSRVGDQRAVLSLFDIMAAGPSTWAREAKATIACIAHRTGRQTFVDNLTPYFASAGVDDPRGKANELADLVYATPEPEAHAHFRRYYEELTLEELMQGLEAAYGTAFDEPEWADDYDEAFWDPMHDGFDYDDPFVEEDASTQDLVFRAPGAAPEPRTFARPGRNDPCWCGSGKKYKNCHWQADQRDELGRVQTG